MVNIILGGVFAYALLTAILIRMEEGRWPLTN
jgi:hypothetical protein